MIAQIRWDFAILFADEYVSSLMVEWPSDINGSVINIPNKSAKAVVIWFMTNKSWIANSAIFGVYDWIS